MYQKLLNSLEILTQIPQMSQIKYKKLNEFYGLIRYAHLKDIDKKPILATFRAPFRGLNHGG